MFGDQRMPSDDAIEPLRQPGPRQPPTVPVLDLDVVVILGPVVSDEQHPQQLLRVGLMKGQHPADSAT